MNELDKQFIRLEKKAKSYLDDLTEADLALLHQAHLALAGLLKGGLNLAVYMNDAGIDQATVRQLSLALFISAAVLSQHKQSTRGQ